MTIKSNRNNTCINKNIVKNIIANQLFTVIIDDIFIDANIEYEKDNICGDFLAFLFFQIEIKQKKI